MSKRVYVLVLGLAVVAGWAGGLASGRLQTTPAVQAKVESPAKAESSEEGGAGQWEYCAVTRAGLAPSIRRGFYAISYFGRGGVRVVDVDENASERAALTKAIARLGEEGWELVGEAQVEFKAGVGEKALYFKRRKS